MFKKVVASVLIFLLIVVSIIVFAYWNLNREVSKEISGLVLNASQAINVVATEGMFKGLPAPVKRCLVYSGVVGKPIPHSVHLKQSGRIRQDTKASWMDFEADEYYSLNPPSFIWKASLPSAKFPIVTGMDKYSGGLGSMKIKMLSLIPFVNAKGSEINQGAMMRYLNEMMWFPASYLGENINWRAIDDNSAEVILSDSGLTARAIIYFDSEGKITNFVAKRYRSVGDKFELETWSTPITEYKEFNGIKIPSKGKATWKLEGGDFEYIELEIEGLEYDFVN